MIVFDHTKHKALWNMIISILHDPNTNISCASELKEEAFRRLYPYDATPLATCYACEYDENINDTFKEEDRPEDCTNCPLNWPDDLVCSEEYSLFDKFCDACRCKDYLTAILVARYIRDCPVKENVDIA